jgi:serine/threonine-protein kinase
LAAIHAADIIHRDLKPGNVLLATADTSAFPRAKISDFGVASIGDSPGLPLEGRAPPASLQLTTTGASVGTPMYMAPEVQYGAGGALPATDIFSFGVMARELLGLDSSCYGVPLGMAMRAGAKPTLRPLAQAIPTLPSDVARLLDACLAEEPAHRPTASQLVHALENLS